uniref:Uncharacterized protein n=1 Tax=uncultured Nocardioidaceae bacterium TaxID=253824 RepID=A0A6J4MKT8_9ACTN|nr:MAG: hypothetical protein AVDCRST_MAG46-3250 [uncultured Nocardioidaceae bacterium]
METRDLANLAYFLDSLAVVEATEGSYDRVPVLQGAAQGIREAIGTVGYGYYRPDEQLAGQAAEQARDHLGEDRFDDALDAGRALEQADAVALALDPAAGAARPDTRTRTPAQPTPAHCPHMSGCARPVPGSLLSPATRW